MLPPFFQAVVISSFVAAATAWSSSKVDLFLCLGHHARFFFFFFLEGILFTLTLSAAQALGGQTLVAKGGPRAKVLASLAPLDLKAAVGNHPNVDIAQSAETFVLGRNDSVTAILVTEMILSIVVARGETTIVFASRLARLLSALGSSGARTRLPTHDTTPHSFWEIDGLFLRHVRRKVHKARKLRHWC